MSEELIIYSLLTILIIVLIAPLLSRKIEENLEIFFIVMGFIAATVAGSLSVNLLIEALATPIILHDIPFGIFQAVLIAGLVFERYKNPLSKALSKIKKDYLPALYGLMVFSLGLGSSIISAIVGSVIISEFAKIFNIPQRVKTYLLILAAYSIGVGAVLTPIGEPLSTIAISKLKQDFFFLANLLLDYVLAIVIFASIASWIIYKVSLKSKDPIQDAEARHNEISESRYKDAIIRAIKIYGFIFGLVLLGHSFDIIVEKYIIHLDPKLLYIFGSISAVLDNATLTAAIITPDMDLFQIKSFLLSLLIAGGFLIPGNVPNIVIAYTHRIGFKEWAKFSLPIGIPIFVITFLILFI